MFVKKEMFYEKNIPFLLSVADYLSLSGCSSPIGTETSAEKIQITLLGCLLA